MDNNKDVSFSIINKLIADTIIQAEERMIKKIKINNGSSLLKIDEANNFYIFSELLFYLWFTLDLQLYINEQNDSIREEFQIFLLNQARLTFGDINRDEKKLFSTLVNRNDQYALLVNHEKDSLDEMNKNMGKFTTLCIVYSIVNYDFYEPKDNESILTDIENGIILKKGVGPLEMGFGLDIYVKAILPYLSLFTRKIEYLLRDNKNIFEIDENTANKLFELAEKDMQISKFESSECLQ